MKKLFLAVAVLAASLSASAQTEWTFDGTETITSGVTTPTLLKNNLYYTDGSSKTAIDANSKTWSTGTYAFRYKTGGAGAVDGSGSALLINVSGNSTINICAIASSSSATRKLEIAKSDGTIVASALVTGANPSEATAPLSFDYTGGAATLYIYSASQDVDADTDGYTSGGLNFYMINATNVADVKDAIASDLLKKVANELVNPTNLEVEVYSVSGVKVLTSSEASISVSGLANGAYIAKTAEGTLKFVK